MAIGARGLVGGHPPETPRRKAKWLGSSTMLFPKEPRTRTNRPCGQLIQVLTLHFAAEGEMYKAAIAVCRAWGRAAVDQQNLPYDAPWFQGDPAVGNPTLPLQMLLVLERFLTGWTS